MPGLTWLPHNADWKRDLAALPDGPGRWPALRALANAQMDFLRTAQLERRLRALPLEGAPEPIRLALLASSTVDQLLPGLHVAALRRGLRLDIHVPDFGQYRHALIDPHSALAAFAPQVVLMALDAREMVPAGLLEDAAAATQVADRIEELAGLWRIAKARFGAQIIQQTLLPVFPPLMGGAEHRAPGSPASRLAALNAALRTRAAAEHIDILALDEQAQRHGVDAWHSIALWNRAKQEVSPSAAPLYGELAMRIVAAQRGRSAKCLVLDLDNTLWGGVIGDDGLEGVALGQGSAEGEAFLAFQRYAHMLGQRGVILAVCSKNDEANALEPFEKHPDMILRRGDIAAFVANWDDKATNVRRIAAELNIGLDALVFVDDNPFERNIVRRELPEVCVPELPEDPALYGQTLADAGYFEALEITSEDRARGASYQATRALRAGQVDPTDLAGYLASLEMELIWGRFDALSLKRVTQLINKTNQFNLMTRRYTEADIAAVCDDPSALGLHFRLTDRFADHGIIGIVIGRADGERTLEVDTWLMSCRVLGRGVEAAMMAVLAEAARDRGVQTIVGRYRPTSKNAMVRDHYRGLGFRPLTGAEGDETSWVRDLSDGADEPLKALSIKELVYG